MGHLSINKTHISKNLLEMNDPQEGDIEQLVAPWNISS